MEYHPFVMIFVMSDRFFLKRVVPMDLDVKMKAVMMGATFLIVRHCLYNGWDDVFIIIPKFFRAVLVIK